MGPMDFATAGLKTWHMAAQSAAVVGMRMAGMAGAWSMPASEYGQMVVEKQAAFAEAKERLVAALGAGAPPLVVYEAVLTPLERQTRANALRLTRDVLGR